jgi:hypothetical protein
VAGRGIDRAMNVYNKRGEGSDATLPPAGRIEDDGRDRNHGPEV